MSKPAESRSPALYDGAPADPSERPVPPATASTALRIFLVDDHTIVRDGLKQIISRSFSQALFGEGCNAREALAAIEKSKWDVMLLDISMPGQSGLDVLKQIKSLQPETKVLVVTMHPEDQYAARVLKAGASGYLTKETASEEIVNALTKILAGGKYASAAFAQTLLAGLDNPLPKAPHELLSDREYQVLRMLATGKCCKEIGCDLGLSIKTVSTYRTREVMLPKIGPHGHEEGPALGQPM
jgi:two-component system invasion response regulator UvrY